jgi:RNA polymerase sigma-70 factor (ECF subfamily)
MSRASTSTGTTAASSAHLEACLARLPCDREGAINELTALVYGRFRMLTGRILSQQFPDLQGQTDDVWHEALLKLRTALRNESVVPATAKELSGLAARHIRFALYDMVQRFRQGRTCMPLADDSGSAVPGLELEQSTFDPEILAAWSEFHKSIECLAPDLRDVIDLLFYDGLSQQEAAQILDVPVTTVQGRWRSAKVRLAMSGLACLPD